MKILAIDTATLTASVAAWDGALRAERHERVTTHSDQLLTTVDTVLREAGWSMDEVALVACGAGPGSFTGLRIGLGTAKGLAFASRHAGGCALMMISSLAALARRGLVESRLPRVVAVLDAHKHEVYAGFYGGERVTAFADEIVGPPAALRTRLLAELAAGPLALVGDGLARYPELLVDGAAHVAALAPRGEDLAALARQRWDAGERDDLDAAHPRYIRASEAEVLKALQAAQVPRG